MSRDIARLSRDCHGDKQLLGYRFQTLNHEAHGVSGIATLEGERRQIGQDFLEKTECRTDLGLRHVGFFALRCSIYMILQTIYDAA